ncbi:hypothetical protein [Methylobacterium sp. J-068]|uniref:hypothetical protein n=1 Tax=Methylobacterium sp. J-068 TaxID=2836649 RepID=UPI001FBA51CF|nr:hypothetical protein [Methylobacterium sp. J-068]MCJ2033081.1 hypothetical protein [Methylobacterium sp. J-068]
MSRLTTLAGTAFILGLSATTAFAAPCSTGSTGQNPSQADKSSKVEPGSTGNVTPGAKAESPGTVGALNGVGTDRATSPSDVAKQTEGKPTAAQKAEGC